MQKPSFKCFYAIFIQSSPSIILPSHFSDGNHPSIPIQGTINHGVNILTKRNICFPYIPISCFLFSNHVHSPTCTSSGSNLRVSSPNCSSPGRPCLSSRDQQIFWGNSWIILEDPHLLPVRQRPKASKIPRVTLEAED